MIWMMNSKAILLFLLAMTLILTSCAALAEEPASASKPLSLLAVNVVKADALLLRSGETAYLIDTGTKKSFDALCAALQSEGVTHLDGIILTHTHSDHAGGLKKLLESDLAIDALYASAYYDCEPDKHPAAKALKKSDRDLEVIWLRGGDTLPLDGGTLEVLGPLNPSDTENCNSLVLLASGGGGTMLLTGDMEFPEEAELLAAGLIPKVDVLKVGNHGEGDATSDAFIAAAQPKVAVISTNTPEEPDTPDPRVIRLLNRYGVQILQTQDTPFGVQVTLQSGEILTELK